MQPLFLSVNRSIFLDLTGLENGRVHVLGGCSAPNKVLLLGGGFSTIFIFGQALKI